MSKKTTSNYNRSYLIRLSQLLKFQEYNKVIKLLEDNISLNPEKVNVNMTWEKDSMNFINFLKAVISDSKENLSSLLKPELVLNPNGNKKLKFLSFSNLPIVNCIGAGACLNFCYSLKAWRYPRAYFKQARNTVLMDRYFTIIDNYMGKIVNSNQFKKHDRIDFRLYVDGDFYSKKELKNWMELLKKYPVLRCYGYSKSLTLFKELHEEGYIFPDNYKLNLSNGGKFDKMFNWCQENLSIVRGKFLAVNIGKGQSGFNRNKTQKELLKQKLGNKKYFVCGGVCDTCTIRGHACGLDSFKNIDIVIPIH